MLSARAPKGYRSRTDRHLPGCGDSRPSGIEESRSHDRSRVTGRIWGRRRPPGASPRERPGPASAPLANARVPRFRPPVRNARVPAPVSPRGTPGIPPRGTPGSLAFALPRGTPGIPCPAPRVGWSSPQPALASFAPPGLRLCRTYTPHPHAQRSEGLTNGPWRASWPPAPPASRDRARSPPARARQADPPAGAPTPPAPCRGAPASRGRPSPRRRSTTSA